MDFSARECGLDKRARVNCVALSEILEKADILWWDLDTTPRLWRGTVMLIESEGTRKEHRESCNGRQASTPGCCLTFQYYQQDSKVPSPAEHPTLGMDSPKHCPPCDCYHVDKLLTDSGTERVGTFSSLLTGSQGGVPGYILHVTRTVKAQEGLCIFVPCSFSSPERSWLSGWSAYGYWFKQSRKLLLEYAVATNNKYKSIEPGAQERFQLLGDPLKKNCSLLIKDVRQEDATSYFFRVERGSEKYSFLDGFILQVEALMRKPDVFVPETLEPGQPVTVVCLFSSTFEQCPAPSFSWTGAAVFSQDITQHTSHNSYSVLSFRAALEHHGTELTCRLDFSRKSTQRTVRLSVAYAPRSLAISISRDNVSVPEWHGNTPHLEVQQGQSLRLLCTADSHPPATLIWALEERVLSWSSPMGSRTLALELPWVKAEDSGRYTCRAENRLGSQQHTLNLSVLYPPEDLRVTVSQANRTVLEILKNGTSLPVLEGQSLCLVCVTYSKPPASLSWSGVTQTLIPGQSSDPGVLDLPLVQREHEGEFTCAAQNPLGTQSISLSLSVHYPPQMSRPSCSWEAEGLHCSCSSLAWPAPSLHWRLDEGLLEGNSSNASFTVTSSSLGPRVNSSLSLLGKLGPGLWLSCEAWNIHGAQSASIMLLPDKDSPTAFSKGAVLGSGITALITLCLIMIIVKMLQKKRSQEETSRPKISRGSTILDYINVVPKTRSLARNCKAKSNTPSGIPPLDTDSPKSKKKQKLPHFTSPGCADPKSSSQAPVSENNPEELHYAVVNFSRPRLRETQSPQDTHSDYAEVRFY
ncbi:sialic acid-binding Ig-like lectin 10 [Acomys russatus]|uniref:sialic acid-binding Ig-like lectin 10 n=1 Tax=Acomys russatus TaxID=60746 RepID=UPI0021E20355|nr:sialic acid-binding Ig-like lectin 10 [Acomys russatus]